jgi:hypothetical protein
MVQILTIQLQHRYDSFLYTVQIWRHLKLLKRTGRGHVPEPVLETKDGECAVECPACPHPDRNLPADWKSRAKS